MLASRQAAFAEESAEVEVLYANVEKMKSLTRKIQGSMARLETSGRTVQEAIGPIYGNTQRLQVTNANIDRMLAAIERIKEPLDMRNREERIIRSRPDKVGLQEYISSIDRTSQALRDLKTANLRSNQQAVSDLTDLLTIGTQNLEDVFRDILRQDSQPIEPLKQITTGSEFPRIPSNRSQQLRTINAHIYNFAEQSGKAGDLTPSATAYAHERGEYITLSLQNLAAACISTARKVNPDAIYKQGSNAISSYALGIQGMYTAEYDNICPVFSREQWGQVLSATCHGSLSAFASTMRELNQLIQSSLITDCYLAYEIVDVVSSTSFHLENRTGELKNAFSDALKPVRETAKSSLSMLLQDVRARVQQINTVPLNGSTVSVTTEVMTRLQLMTSYLPPLSSVMRSLGDGGWSAPNLPSSSMSTPTLKSFDVGADGKQLFAHYCSDTIETLLSNLESRARSVNPRTRNVQGVFLANNVSVIERMINSSELSTLLRELQPRLESWKKKATQIYIEEWITCAKNLQDAFNTRQRPPSTGQAIDSAAIVKSMSTNDKNAIKMKFDSFNVAFDNNVSMHKGFRMEADVRQRLGSEVRSLVEPMYNRWWDRYHDVDKGKGKHVKYDKSQMASVLNGLLG